ncbi:MAG: universal stress protein [Candidatus Tectimicrobiota bacterium]|nr:MAG: universal stress protein [Candidatus Tectomicrobia bacterium]
MYTKILVPLDGSEVAEVALPHAVALARTFGAELVLLRVAHAPFSPGRDPLEAERAAVEESEQYLAEAAQRLAAQGVPVRTVVRYGKAAEEILDHAATEGISLIVMATHGRSGVGRWLLGSTAEKVVRATSQPVLLVRAATPHASQV